MDPTTPSEGSREMTFGRAKQRRRVCRRFRTLAAEARRRAGATSDWTHQWLDEEFVQRLPHVNQPALQAGDGHRRDDLLCMAISPAHGTNRASFCTTYFGIYSDDEFSFKLPPGWSGHRRRDMVLLRGRPNYNPDAEWMTISQATAKRDKQGQDLPVPQSARQGPLVCTRETGSVSLCRCPTESWQSKAAARHPAEGAPARK